jgi:predicted ATPase
VSYVAETLSRPKADVIPLAAVIQSKTAGSPFYMREMLNTCHRKQCIWYDYRDNGWCYDLDRVFKHFATRSYHDILDSEFVTNRLGELPPITRSILGWASLIGASFSFSLVQKLLTGEFDYSELDSTKLAGDLCCLSHPGKDSVEGLQPAISGYIIIQTQDDDRFRFAHDRYVQAAIALCGRNRKKMHFIIAQTLLKYHLHDEQLLELIALHVSESVEIIKEQVERRHAFREVLFDCAQAAAETGARPTAWKYYVSCFSLLQNDPWNDGPDASYVETLDLYIRAAECAVYMDQLEEAKRLLAAVIEHGKTPVDKASAWVLRARVYVQEHQSASAFKLLNACLAELDIEVDPEPSYAKCDEEYEAMSREIRTANMTELIARRLPDDSNLSTVGAIFLEAISAAYWTCKLTVSPLMSCAFNIGAYTPVLPNGARYDEDLAVTR